MKLPRFNQLKKERKKWKQYGEPVRTNERIQELFQICSSCEHYESFTLSQGQCQLCTCFISSNRKKVNKLRFATSRCPINKWIEEPGLKKTKTKKRCC